MGFLKEYLEFDSYELEFTSLLGGRLEMPRYKHTVIGDQLFITLARSVITTHTSVLNQ